jgi:ribosome-associated toxin RatA of RatAB toxin-antitoxin module
MKHVKKSVLLWYSAREIYELVVDVESYPKFLPWCERAEILERTADGLTARLHLAYSGLRHAFTTKNVTCPTNRCRSRSSTVRSRSSTASGGSSPCRCRARLRTPVPPAHAGSSSTCATHSPTACSTPRSARCSTGSPGTFVDSFVRRAEQVHGPR